MRNGAFKIIVLPFLYLVSILPFWLLYRLSDLLYVVVYYIAGYRKNVVMNNLRNSFPEKDEKELKKISRLFYRHFCDVIFETVKLLTISRKQFIKRCRFDQEGLDTFNGHILKNQSIIGVMGHCGNWEWAAMAHQLYFTRMITGVYHPLSNRNFDALMKKLRGRFGGDIVPMQQLYKRLINLKNAGISTTIGLIADQTPPPESAYWTTFLNQDTPVFNGPEKLARKFNYPVVYLEVKKTGRGYYLLSASTIVSMPRELPEGMISELHTRQLEQNIRMQPHTWLWSHRRWKHKKPAI